MLKYPAEITRLLCIFLRVLRVSGCIDGILWIDKI